MELASRVTQGMAAMFDRLRDLWTERPAVVAAAVIAPVAFVITLLILFLAVGGGESVDQQAESAAQVEQSEQAEQAEPSAPSQTTVTIVETQGDDQQDEAQTQPESSDDQQQSEAADPAPEQQESAEPTEQEQASEQQQAESEQQESEDVDEPLTVAGHVVAPLDEVLEEAIDEEALQHGSDGSEGGILPIANGVVVSSQPEQQTTWELLVPSAGLKSSIVRVGRTRTGAMGSPDNPYVIGWLDSSAVPGETGNTLLAGHRDFEDKSGNIGTGVCWELVNTAAGDQMIVRDNDNEIYYIYTVTEAVTVNPRDRDAVRYLQDTDESVITLITCTGAFNAETHQYSHRFVVVGVLAAVASPDA